MKSKYMYAQNWNNETIYELTRDYNEDKMCFVCADSKLYSIFSEK